MTAVDAALELIQGVLLVFVGSALFGLWLGMLTSLYDIRQPWLRVPAAVGAVLFAALCLGGAVLLAEWLS